VYDVWNESIATNKQEHSLEVVEMRMLMVLTLGTLTQQVEGISIE